MMQQEGDEGWCRGGGGGSGGQEVHCAEKWRGEQGRYKTFPAQMPHPAVKQQTSSEEFRVMLC